MFDKLYKISNKEYLEKDISEVIDGKTDKDYRFTVNGFFSKNIKPTKKYIDISNITTKARHEYIQTDNYRQVYDHMRDFRIVVPDNYPRKTIRCTFSTPYNTLEGLKENLKEPWILDNYKIYLVNPLLYKYYQPKTVTLAHVDNLDKNTSEKETDYLINLINEGMVEETGEPLFYLI